MQHAHQQIYSIIDAKSIKVISSLTFLSQTFVRVHGGEDHKYCTNSGSGGGGSGSGSGSMQNTALSFTEHSSHCGVTCSDH